MTTTISLVSDKGGVGKTAAVILLAGEYALEGKSVLILDADNTRRVAGWIEACVRNDNEPANIDVEVGSSANEIQSIIRRAKERYDVMILDAPGKVTIAHDEMIALSDIVLTPIAPGRDELDALSAAVETIATISDQLAREIPHGVFFNNLVMTDKGSLAYKTMGEFMAALKEAGYTAQMMQSEILHRVMYRDLRAGMGTLQMQDISPSVTKARAEVTKFKNEVESIIAAAKGGK